MLSRRTKRVLAGVAGLLLAYSFAPMYFFVVHGARPKWMIKLPNFRDPRLSGTWTGTWQISSDLPRTRKTTVLHADGTGQFDDDGKRSRQFEWGTEDGVFFTRSFSVDSWAGNKIPYQLSNNGTTVRFTGPRMFSEVTDEMNRVAANSG